ncbi:UNVERIFIED_CONTAM: hypothetical protein NCL1_20739 [Trichonephila clavipes]
MSANNWTDFNMSRPEVAKNKCCARKRASSSLAACCSAASSARVYAILRLFLICYAITLVALLLLSEAQFLTTALRNKEEKLNEKQWGKNNYTHIKTNSITAFGLKLTITQEKDKIG